MTYQPTVCVDFDGVVHSYASGWTGPVPTDPPEPGALEFVSSLVDAGFKVVIFTTRASTTQGFEATRRWLNENGFPVGLKITNHKVPAVAYVDDRAVAYVPRSGAFGACLSAVKALAVRK